MLNRLAAAGAATMMLAVAPGHAQQPRAATALDLELWRLDCGGLDNAPLGWFSDTFAYEGETRRLTDSCYLIRNGNRYLLWDTGFGAAEAGRADPFPGLIRGPLLTEQLRRIRVRPEQVTFLGISHIHEDHIGGARQFPRATLLIGTEDLEDARTGDTSRHFAPWLTGGATVEAIDGDKDVFGDGSVVMLDLPGHTRGHHALLVRLPGRGPILLSGDQFHFIENMASNGVPSFNQNRANTLASSDRFRAIQRNLNATVIIQHEPRDIGKLPAFPESAR
jgi:N-acyl homoserine lactone hydrolase